MVFTGHDQLQHPDYPPLHWRVPGGDGAVVAGAKDYEGPAATVFDLALDRAIVQTIGVQDAHKPDRVRHLEDLRDQFHNIITGLAKRKENLEADNVFEDWHVDKIMNALLAKMIQREEQERLTDAQERTLPHPPPGRPPVQEPPHPNCSPSPKKKQRVSGKARVCRGIKVANENSSGQLVHNYACLGCMEFSGLQGSNKEGGWSGIKKNALRSHWLAHDLKRDNKQPTCPQLEQILNRRRGMDQGTAKWSQ